MPILPFGWPSVTDKSCYERAFERVDDVVMISCRAQKEVLSVIAEFEFRPGGHGLSCRLQVFGIRKREGSEWLFVIVAKVVEEDAWGGGVWSGDGEDYARGVEGCEEGGGED